MIHLFFILAILGLTACTSTPIGFGKAAPNEFVIITYPPLTIPPNLTLRKPAGAEAVEQKKGSAVANRLLFGVSAKRARTLSGSEKVLLRKLGTDKAQRDIRKRVTADRGLAGFAR